MSNAGPESTVPPAASGGGACIGSQPVAGADAGQARAKPPFKFSAKTRVGFSDTDAQGIVYYGRYNPYFDLARVEYLRSLGFLHREAGGEFVMRANDVEYEIHIRVSKIGRTSMTCEFAAFKVPDGTLLLVTAHQTLVFIDLEKRR